MIAIAVALVEPASAAGIEVPKDLSVYLENDFPYWTVYLNAQLGARMPTPTSHWSNARIVAAIPEENIRSITAAELLDLGFEI